MLFLVCTDGLYDEVSNPEMIDIIKENESMSDICNRMIEKANSNGGHDNITVICLRVTEEDIHEQ